MTNDSVAFELSMSLKVGRVAPRAPSPGGTRSGAHGVTRPTFAAGSWSMRTAWKPRKRPTNLVAQVGQPAVSPTASRRAPQCLPALDGRAFAGWQPAKRQTGQSALRPGVGLRYLCAILKSRGLSKVLVWWASIASLNFIHAASDASVPQKRAAETSDSTYRWYSLPVEVTGIPTGAEFVPVSCAIDFTEILNRLKQPGAVDERSLRLYRISARGKETEEPVQFLASPQPRPKERRSLADTPPNVSYVGEYAADETPAVPRVTGELTWIVRASESPSARPSAPRNLERIGARPNSPGALPQTFRYRLKFGVLRTGRLIQVPYPPQNLRSFDAAGRALPVRWFPRMQIRPQWPAEGVVHIWDDQQLFTSYHRGPHFDQAITASPVHRRPFFYPVIGPDGVALTEFGKPHDPTGSHAHHYSLWIAHANVNGKDFWSEKGGLIAHEQFELMEDGPLFCRLIQKTRWLDNGAALLQEKRQLTFFQTPEHFRLIDIDLEFTPSSTQPVVFGKTSFGFLAARVAQSMTVFDGAGEITNARGQRNEQGAHLQRAEWIDLSGPIAQEKRGGLALLDHPDNLNHPTGWHCRNDGWAGAAFNMDQPYTLEPGAKLRLRYRIHLHRHNAAEGEVARRYEEYRTKPVVQLGEAR